MLDPISAIGQIYRVVTDIYGHTPRVKANQETYQAFVTQVRRVEETVRSVEKVDDKQPHQQALNELLVCLSSSLKMIDQVGVSAVDFESGLRPLETLMAEIERCSKLLSVDSAVECLKNLREHFASGQILQDDQRLYIPLMGSATPNDVQTTDAAVMVDDFLKSPKKIMLLTGESGSGKSFFVQNLIMRKAAKFQPGDRVPLLISLPSIKKPIDSLLSEFFSRFHVFNTRLEWLRKTQSFFLVLDGYDEARLDQNLYTGNGLGDWDVKIIIVCRTSYLTTISNHPQCFLPFSEVVAKSALFQELHLAPLTQRQSLDYMDRYLVVNQDDIAPWLPHSLSDKEEWLKSTTYQQWIDRVPGLKPLISTPFLLKATMEGLPRIVAEFQGSEKQGYPFKLTSVELIDAFVHKWFQRQEKILLSLGTSPCDSLYKCYREFATRLAMTMHKYNVTQVTYDEDSDFGGDPVAREDWATLFSEKFVSVDRGDPKRRERRIAVRKGCPLQQLGSGQYAFLPGLLEHFVAKGLAQQHRVDPVVTQYKASTTVVERDPFDPSASREKLGI